MSTNSLSQLFSSSYPRGFITFFEITTFIRREMCVFAEVCFLDVVLWSHPKVANLAVFHPFGYRLRAVCPVICPLASGGRWYLEFCWYQKGIKNFNF